MASHFMLQRGERNIMSELWAVLEHVNAALHEQSGELLSEVLDIARQQPGTTVRAILLTDQQATLPNLALLSALCIQHLYILTHPVLARYSTRGYVDALSWLLAQHKPALVATSATLDGRDWTARLAARLHLPFVPSCLGLELHDDALFALRSIYEGRAYVQTRTALHGQTALATLVPGVRGIRGTGVKKDETSTRAPDFTITHLEPVLPVTQERIRHISRQAPSAEEIELEVAERIVAGGRGIGQSGFSTIARFAHELGAAVGATRVATDLGWIEHARQIGATGKIVHPKLYIACGISGAAQHTSGMAEAQTVVAINPDRSAPIFALADLGLLGDANEILPRAAQLLDATHTTIQKES